MGFSNNLSLLINKTKKPYLFMLFLFLFLFFIIYSERLFNLQSEIYHILTTSFILGIFVLIILSTILSKMNIGGELVKNFNKLFNDTTCRNIIALFSFVFYLIFLYEIKNYDNNDKNIFIDQLLFGNNNFISNRTFGIMLIIMGALITGYTISINTKN